MTDDLNIAIERLKRGGLKVPAAAEQALSRQLDEFGSAIDANTKKQLRQKFLDGLKSINAPVQVQRAGEALTVTEGATPSSLTGAITKMLLPFDGGAAIAQMLNLPFKIDVANSVMRGAGNFLDAQLDVDEYPGWELFREFDVDVPRGFKMEKKSRVVVPDDDWPARWEEAGAASADDDWLPWKGDSQRGSGIALKSSDIWNQLGSLRDDSLGNNFPPFAFNSGFRCAGVPYNECVQAGLIDDGDKADPAKIDFEKLFAIPEPA